MKAPDFASEAEEAQWWFDQSGISSTSLKGTVKVNKFLGRWKRSDHGAANTWDTLLAADSAGLQVERVIFEHLFSLLSRDLVAGDRRRLAASQSKAGLESNAYCSWKSIQGPDRLR